LSALGVMEIEHQMEDGAEAHEEVGDDSNSSVCRSQSHMSLMTILVATRLAGVDFMLLLILCG